MLINWKHMMNQYHIKWISINAWNIISKFKVTNVYFHFTHEISLQNVLLEHVFYRTTQWGSYTFASRT
jgi:hypothetical protein